MGRLFGTDGVRGIANKELTPELAFKLGKAGAYVLKKKNDRPVIIIGKDTRVSGDMLEAALTAGILAVGGNVIKVGVVPTPAVAYLTRYYHADAGIVISASHNTFEYNGIKFFNGEGFKLDDLLEEKIEDIIISSIDVNSHITGDRIGKCLEAEESAADLYVKRLLDTVDYRLDGCKVVLDCANGASYQIAERVYRSLGADVTVIGNEPDGININEACGSTHPEKLQEAVVRLGADIGLAFDGDADRCIAVSGDGTIIDGDLTMYVYGVYMKERGKLLNNTVVTTVMSNFGLYKAFEAAGIDYEKTAVGDKYVYENMVNNGHRIGGEQSGHIIFSKYATTGDGILTSLKLMEVMLAKEKTLSQLAAPVKIFPQVLKNIRVKSKPEARGDEAVIAAVDGVAAKLGNEGRILVRESGTEPVIRVMVEAATLEECESYVDEVIEVIKKQGHAV